MKAGGLMSGDTIKITLAAVVLALVATNYMQYNKLKLVCMQSWKTYGAMYAECSGLLYSPEETQAMLRVVRDGPRTTEGDSVGEIMNVSPNAR
jgi:hypothetical protein